MMSLLEIIFWAIWYPLELAHKNPIIAYILLGVLAIFLIISPIIHKDTFHGWGLNNFLYIFKKIKEGGRPRAIAITVLALFMAIGIAAFYLLWKQLADALFNMNENDAISFRNTVGGSIAVIALGAGAGFFVATILIRYDNFLNSLKVAVIVIVILGCAEVGGSLLLNPSDINNFDAADFALNFLGYIFWGALQQFLFVGYFGSRFRKAFGPSVDAADPGNPTKAESRAMYKKRACIALINGSYFGLIHIPSWSLASFTWILGVVLSWYYMKDKNRNLLAMGMIHGFLGSMVGVFYKSSVSMSVGPSTGAAIAMAPWFWIVAIFLVAHQAIIVLAWWYWDGRKPVASTIKVS